MTVSQTSVGLVIEYPDGLIFRAGQSWSLSLVVSNGKGPFVWQYNGLPAGLIGDARSGRISGSVVNSGYYSFNVECADSTGNSAVSYYTINVQPQTNVQSNYKFNLATQIVDVKTVSTTPAYDINAVESEQINADNALFAALDAVNKQKQNVAEVQAHVAIATANQQSANSNAAKADQNYNQALSDRDNAQQNLVTASYQLDGSQKNLNLAQIEQTNSGNNVNVTQTAVNNKQAAFNTASDALTAAQKADVAANISVSNAQLALTNATTVRDASKNEYTRSISNLEVAKTNLDDSLKVLQSANISVQAARDVLGLTQQANDDAIAALKVANDTLAKAESDLNNANILVSVIRGKKDVALNDYNSA